jgi:hypothetical protein
VPIDPAGGRWQRLADFTDELLARLVEADHRAARVMRPVVDVEGILHVADELSGGLRRDAPHPP